MACNQNRDYRGGLIGGLVIVIVGFALLLDHMGVLNIDHFYRFWPCILIVVGIANLSHRSGWVKGALLILFGAVLQLDQLNIVHFRWSELWPLLVIGAGLSIIWRTMQAPKNPVAAGDARDTLNELAVFGGIERRITSRTFKGGRAHATFGGIELDLRDAEMEGDEVVLDINAIFGGIEITVPPHWSVASHGQGIFGGYVDSTRSRQPESVSGVPPKTLLVQGVAIFGGVEIKN
ncbi:MAG TPA: DUF5668 domain-containing protein [Candidatus Saccharimonadales bacterium]|nr:DUF5668 domain-containing protein [Candidatus Saccharimonadales bacterium]